MSAFGKVISVITNTVNLNDKILSLSDKVKDLSVEIHNINCRVIRLETFIEIAEKQRGIARNVLELV
jgi:hypothetical protein